MNGASTVAVQRFPAHSVSPQNGALAAAVRFVQQNPLRFVVCSVAILLPCFWHRHIQAMDLGSHMYNAWLASLIRQGKAPGLHIVSQYNNVLFDWLIDGLFSRFGAIATERIAVSLCVLVFFWGGFALTAAVVRRACWEIIPLLAMTTYGLMFNMGFMNLYLSVGLSFFVLALLWSGRDWELMLVFPPLGMIWLAHAVGTAGAIAFGAYLILARLLGERRRVILIPITLAAYLFLRAAALHYLPIIRGSWQFHWLAGADYFALNAQSYLWISETILLLAVTCIALNVVSGGTDAISPSNTWLQLYIVLAIVLATLPDGFVHPRLGSLGYLPERVSIYAAMILCILVGLARPGKRTVTAFTLCAGIFFVLLYFDTLALDRMEQKIETVVDPLRPGDRVVAAGFAVEGRLHEQHIVDRACIGHCFYVANYEPSSQQFRIKADPGNRIVASTSADSALMQSGQYRVRPEDLPLKAIYPCGPKLMDACIRELSAGEFSGSHHHKH